MTGVQTCALPICTQDKGWTPSDKEKAVKMCTDQLDGKFDKKISKGYCDCVMEQAMKKYKNFADMDRKGTEADGRTMGLACAKELLGAGK